MGQGQPWRTHSEEFKWSKEFSETLKTDVVKLSKTCKFQPNVLLFGPSGHGKSSFINSLSTISLNRKSNITNSAQSEGHTTSVFRTYNFDGVFDSFLIGDTKGVVLKTTDNKNLVENIRSIIEGHVKPNIETKEFPREGKYFIEKPKEEDKVHCVIFVIRITVFDKQGSSFQVFEKETTKLLENLNYLDVPRIAVLTHADLIDEKVNADISYMFHSEKVKDAVSVASEVLGIPEENIFPIVNYAKGQYSNIQPLLHIPILLALDIALSFVQDTIHKRQLQEEKTEVQSYTSTTNTVGEI